MSFFKQKMPLDEFLRQVLRLAVTHQFDLNHLADDERYGMTDDELRRLTTSARALHVAAFLSLLMPRFARGKTTLAEEFGKRFGMALVFAYHDTGLDADSAEAHAEADMKLYAEAVSTATGQVSQEDFGKALCDTFTKMVLVNLVVEDRVSAYRHGLVFSYGVTVYRATEEALRAMLKNVRIVGQLGPSQRLSPEHSMRNFLIAAVVVLVLGYACWDGFLRTTNEIGPIGADKVGRQILLQDFDTYFGQRVDSTTSGYAVNVTSEFGIVPFPIRLLQEPMRTTFLLQYRKRWADLTIDTSFADRLLAMPSDSILKEYRDSVSMRRDWRISPDTLRARLAALGVTTFGQFLAAFGFRKLEADVDGAMFIVRSLPAVGKGNSKWMGS